MTSVLIYESIPKTFAGRGQKRIDSQFLRQCPHTYTCLQLCICLSIANVKFHFFFILEPMQQPWKIYQDDIFTENVCIN